MTEMDVWWDHGRVSLEGSDYYLHNCEIAKSRVYMFIWSYNITYTYHIISSPTTSSAVWWQFDALFEKLPPKKKQRVSLTGKDTWSAPWSFLPSKSLVRQWDCLVATQQKLRKQRFASKSHGESSHMKVIGWSIHTSHVDLTHFCQNLFWTPFMYMHLYSVCVNVKLCINWFMYNLPENIHIDMYHFYKYVNIYIYWYIYIEHIYLNVP